MHDNAVKSGETKDAECYFSGDSRSYGGSMGKHIKSYNRMSKTEHLHEKPLYRQIEDGETFALVVESVLRAKKVNGKPVTDTITVNLKGSKNISILPYFDHEKKTYNREGYQTLAAILVQAMNVNIQSAHQDGMWDSAQQLRYIMAELERLFIQVKEVTHPTRGNVDIDDPL